MTIQEFLDELGTALTGELPEYEIKNHINYYKEYMNSERGAQKEEDITASLGDPRLIARTIIDTFQMQHGNSQHYSYDGTTTSNNESRERYESDHYQKNVSNEKNYKNGKGMRVYHMPNWLVSFITIFVLVIVFSIIFFIGGLILRLFFQIGLPILFIWILFNILRRR